MVSGEATESQHLFQVLQRDSGLEGELPLYAGGLQFVEQGTSIVQDDG